MLRIRLASLLLAGGLTLLCGCNCTGFCLSWHPQCCGGHQHHGNCNTCNTGCDTRKCCDLQCGSGFGMTSGPFVSVPVADVNQPNIVGPQFGIQPGMQSNPPRVVPVPQANPNPYTP